jgi:hypothetical protein
MSIEESLRSSNLHTRTLNKCQRARLLNLHSHTLIAKFDSNDMSNESSQRLHGLEGSLIDFLQIKPD